MITEIAKIEIGTRNGIFTIEGEVKTKNEWDIETGYLQHRDLAKKLTIEKNIKNEDIAYIRVYMNKDVNSFYHIFQYWDGEKFINLI
jgi:hypothetical protein